MEEQSVQPHQRFQVTTLTLSTCRQCRSTVMWLTFPAFLQHEGQTCSTTACVKLALAVGS